MKQHPGSCHCGVVRFEVAYDDQQPCGTHCFARGVLEQLGGAYVSVNVNALDDVDPGIMKPIFWDGRHNNWQAGPRETPWPIN